MRNVFDEEITKGSDSAFKSITDNKITFTSDYPNYVSVDNYGTVTALKRLPNDVSGATITMNVERDGQVILNKTVVVKVKTPKVTGTNLKSTYYVVVGSSSVINVAPVPSKAYITSMRANVSYYDNAIAETVADAVKMRITVKGLKVGKASVTVTMMDENYTSVTKNITIQVLSKPFSSKTKVSVKKPKAGKKQVTLTWKKAKNATGYIVQMSTKKSSGFKNIKKITNGSTLKLIKKKLKSGKKYYFRVRAFGKDSKGKTVNGAWSKVVNTKVK